MFPEPVFHILVVYRYKVLKTHGQSGLLCFQKVPFPFLGFSLELESTLLFLLLCTGVIGVVEFAEPCFG